MAEQAISGFTPHNQNKPAILVADDSRSVRAFFKQILKNDYQLIEAEDGLQAWDLLLKHTDIRLIFSELSMPRLDGRQLLEKIRHSEINRIRNLPFIVVTGKEKAPLIRQTLQDTGATKVINKPFDPAGIISFVSSLDLKQEEESYSILGEELDQTQFLPGINDQRQFMEIAGKELSFAIRNKNELALALLKIDQFEPISTRYSEPAVEHILLTAAEIMRQHIHPDDTMAYFGEGLFAILRPASNTIGTRYIGRRILEDLKAKQFYLAESNKAIGASIGISAPEIKHGTRLQDLLLLAKGRLKAAMDLGGDRVIDKGNDILTQVTSTPDTSLNSVTHSHIYTPAANSSGHPHSAGLKVTPVGAQDGDHPLESAKQIAKLRAMLDRLTQENVGLQEQVDRWRKQSGESEQLRQRVFELESGQQQMELKFSHLNAENLQLHKQTEQAEREIQQQAESEGERSETLKQANRFYEEENLRLEGQLDAVNKRAQKAESINFKSEQLIVSLKDNISLLRVQLEMAQAQVKEAQRQPPTVASALPEAKEQKQVSESSPQDTKLINQVGTSLLLDGFPSSNLSGQKKAPVVAMFPPKEAVIKAAPKPVKKLATVAESFALPVYRTENERTFTRERRPLSSFTIASLLLLLLLAMGSGYLYSYLKQDSLPQASPTLPQAETAKPSVTIQAPPDSLGTAIPTDSDVINISTPTATSRKSRPQPSPSSLSSRGEAPL